MWERHTGLTRSAVNTSTALQKRRGWLQAQIQSNNFFSVVMMDGTTDSSGSDAEIIYIRYIAPHF